MTHDDFDSLWTSRHLELTQIKGETSKQRVQNEFERSKLHRLLDDRLKELEVHKSDHLQNENLTLYRNEIQSAFSENKLELPPIVLARQAQLCQRIHVMTAVDNDLLLVKRQCRDLIKLLEIITRKLAEEIADVELRYVNEIVKLKCEIDELKIKIQHVSVGIEVKDIV